MSRRAKNKPVSSDEIIGLLDLLIGAVLLLLLFIFAVAVLLLVSVATGGVVLVAVAAACVVLDAAVDVVALSVAIVFMNLKVIPSLVK